MLLSMEMVLIRVKFSSCSTSLQGKIYSQKETQTFAGPGGFTNFNEDNCTPSINDLVDSGWKEVYIGHVPQRPITHKGIVDCCEQYTLCHVGSSTINRQMVNTTHGSCPLECLQHCLPWGKSLLLFY